MGDERFLGANGFVVDFGNPVRMMEAMKEMDRARAANHYDMAGHGAKAEEHLRAAEHELHEAIEAARAAR